MINEDGQVTSALMYIWPRQSMAECLFRPAVYSRLRRSCGLTATLVLSRPSRAAVLHIGTISCPDHCSLADICFQAAILSSVLNFMQRNRGDRISRYNPQTRCGMFWKLERCISYPLLSPFHGHSYGQFGDDCIRYINVLLCYIYYIYLQYPV